MKRVIGMITMLVLMLGVGVVAEAQTGERVLESLTDLLRGTQQLQGHVVAIHDADIVVRGRDNRTYTISTTDVDRQQLTRLHPGKPVKVTLKRGGQAPAAAAIEPESGAQRSFRTASGVVDSVSGDRLQFRTNEGFVVPMDLAQIVGPKPSLKPGEPATVTYEAAGQNPIAAVWIEPRDTTGAASPRTSEPAAATGSRYERISGFVESIGIGMLTLKADDGRTMSIDVRNSRGSVGDIRPGDLVNVVGRAAGSDRFVAEVIQKN
jgi:hypothetical protein